MRTKIIEVTNGEQNWGKFMVGVFTLEDVAYKSAITGKPLLREIGHNGEMVLVHDLQTNEGAMFRVGGLAHADLDKHRVWVCPMYEPFLEWLYTYWAGLDALPAHVDLPEAKFALYGHRRKGGEE